MAKLKRIYVVLNTSVAKYADTDAGFELIASRSRNNSWKQSFPDLPHDEREKNRTDYYEFNVQGKGIEENTKLSIRMTSSDDAWLPSSIWVIGETENNSLLILAGYPRWPRDKWFDRGASPLGPDQHDL